MIKNTKCSRGAKHPRRLRTVLRLTITSYEKKKKTKAKNKQKQNNKSKNKNKDKNKNKSKNIQTNKQTNKQTKGKRREKGETSSIEHALVDRTFRGKCYNEFVTGLPP